LRLIIRRKDPEQALAEQKRLLKDAKKRGKQPDPRSLEAAKYILLLTSLPVEMFSAADVLALYRFRWQIELAIKRMKSLAGLARLPAKKPELAQAWIYARLIVAILAEQIAGQAPESPPPVESENGTASPSRWRLMKLALASILAAVRGPLLLKAIRESFRRLRRHLCEPRRRRRKQCHYLTSCLT
jgi:hypothetical protein